MKNLLAAPFIMLLVCCTQQPQPINYGKEECANCKMTIIDEKFGAEIITTKGKIFKFDDVICIVKFIGSGSVVENEISKKLVINYQEKNNFIETSNATFYVSDDLHSPMNGNAAAFDSKEAATTFQNGKTGLLLGWQEVFNKLK